MVKTKTVTIIEFALSAVTFVFGLIGWCAVHSKVKHYGTNKSLKKKSRLLTVLMIIAVWFFIGTAITAFWDGKAGMNVEFSMFSDRVSLFGFSMAKTSFTMWVITAVVLVLC